MKNKNLVEFLESNFKLNDKVTMNLNMGKGSVVDKCYHSATWTSEEGNEYDYTCTSLNYWKRSNVEVTYWDVDELIELFKTKNVKEITHDDLHDITLGEASDGYLEIQDLKWDGKKPRKKELEDLSDMDLYNGEITDSEIEFTAGAIESIEITISKKHNIIVDSTGKYEVNLGPRITEWTVADKKKYERKYKAAMKTLKELSDQYNLIVEAEITENLPKFENYDFDGPTYGNGNAFVFIENTRDWREKEVIQLELETEVGSTVKFQFDDLMQLICLRNNITKAVDNFGRDYSDKKSVTDAWDANPLSDEAASKFYDDDVIPSDIFPGFSGDDDEETDYDPYGSAESDDNNDETDEN